MLPTSQLGSVADGAALFLASWHRHNTCYLSDTTAAVPPYSHISRTAVNSTNELVILLFRTHRNPMLFHRAWECIAKLVNREQMGVLRFLEKAEFQEQDAWLREDLRLAQTVVILADEGCADPYTVGFCRIFHKHPAKVTSWWRDRSKLYRLCELGGSNTPLLHANLADQLEHEIIPDYDYSADLAEPHRRNARPPLFP